MTKERLIELAEQAYGAEVTARDEGHGLEVVATVNGVESVTNWSKLKTTTEERAREVLQNAAEAAQLVKATEAEHVEEEQGEDDDSDE